MMLAVVFMIAVLPSVLSGADTRRRDLLEQIRAGTRVAFLQSIQVQRSWEHAMTYRIERSTTHRGVTFLDSGDMDSRHVVELGAIMTTESNRHVFSILPM